MLVKSHNGKSINSIQDINKTIVSFIVIDNKPHLDMQGVKNLITKSKMFYLVTTNKRHPVFLMQEVENMKIIYYENKIDFCDLFFQLKDKFNIESITIQTGGTLNAILLRNGLLDKVSLVIVPALIGGKNTSTLIDGESLHTFSDLINVKALLLKKIDVLDNSYIHLNYDVNNHTKLSNPFNPVL